MKIRIKKIGQNAFGNWCTFDAIVNDNYIINGIAKYEEPLELKDDKVYEDLVLYVKTKNGRTYFRVLKNS